MPPVQNHGRLFPYSFYHSKPKYRASIRPGVSTKALSQMHIETSGCRFRQRALQLSSEDPSHCEKMIAWRTSPEQEHGPLYKDILVFFTQHLIKECIQPGRNLMY